MRRGKRTWLIGHLRGEQTAAVMENKLSSIEQKLDALLASVDKEEDSAGTDKTDHSGANGTS